MEFTVSKGELNRRKKAFTALLVSIAVGALLFSALFNFSISPIVFLLVCSFFVIIGALTFRYFGSLSQITIRISDHEIERQKGSNIEKYLISEIDSLKLKRRTNGVIREIYISFRNRKHLYINAFEERFESLKDVLISKMGDKISVKEIREPLDFDHFLFYPVLGLIISCASVFFLKRMLVTEYANVKIILLFFSAYTFCLAAYFIIKKPNSIRSGKNQVAVDYVFGICMILVSIWMMVIGLR